MEYSELYSDKITPAPDDEDPVILRRRVRQSYGWSGLSMVFQLLISLAVSMVISIGVGFYSGFTAAQQVADDPAKAQQQIMENVTATTSDPLFTISVNAVCYLCANILAAVIGISALKTFRMKDLFGKQKLPAADICLGALAVLGLQAVSIFIQNIVVSLTGMNGISEETAAVMSFSDNTAANIIMLIYFIIIAPVTEEILMRGFVMNALSPIDRRFALIASSLFFGLMHGNFNQMFNGFLLGLLLGCIAMKSGSVKSSIIAHMAANINAMFCAYVYEYRMLAVSGADAAGTAEAIHFAVLFVIGIIALVFFLKRNGFICPETPAMAGNEISLPAKGLTWQILAKCPSAWVIAVFYIAYGVLSLTPMTV